MAVWTPVFSAPGTAPGRARGARCLLISQPDRVAAHEPKLYRRARYQPFAPGRADGYQPEPGPGACLAREGDLVRL